MMRDSRPQNYELLAEMNFTSKSKAPYI